MHIKRQIKTLESGRMRGEARSGRREVAVEEMSFQLEQEEGCASHTLSVCLHIHQINIQVNVNP